MLDVSIIIPTCQRSAMLANCLAAIGKGVTCDYEVIVVDGASTDGTPRVLDEARDVIGGRLVVIREERRNGFVRAANLGFRAARGRHITWLNDDAAPLPGALDSAVEQMDLAPAHVGLLALFHRSQAMRSVAYETCCMGRAYKLLHVRGTLYANFGLGRRGTFEHLNYFDERYYLNAADPDFSLKVWHAGLRVLPAWGALVDHEETEDDRRAADSPRAREDNEKLFAKWRLPPVNREVNDFDPIHPCTLLGCSQEARTAA